MIKFLNWIRKRHNSVKYVVSPPIKQFVFTGCLPSIPDSRDYSLLTKARIIDVISSKIRLPITAIKNQGTTSSCVAFSIIAAYETARLLSNRDESAIDGSERFLYYYARVQSNLQNVDAGAHLRDGLNAARQNGIALEQYCIFNPAEINDKPSLLAQATAKFLRIKEFYRCWSFDEIKKALNSYLPVVTAIQVREDFFNYKKEIYKSTKQFTGLLHAVTIIGFDDSKNVLLIKNSWSELWGIEGYAWYDYDQFKKDSIEAWAVKVI